MGIFAIHFVGAIIAGLLVALIDSRFRHPRKNFVDAPVKAHPQQTLLRIAAFAVAIVWCSLLLFMLVLLLHSANALPFPGLAEGLLAGPMAAFIAFALVYFLLAFKIRCTSCRRHVFVQWITTPRHQRKIYGMDGWASIVVRILRRAPFRCMYCGQRYLP